MSTLIFIGPASGWLSDKWGSRGLGTLGLIITATAFLLLSGFALDTPYSQVAVYLSIIGFGIGLFRSPNASSVMGAVPANKRGVSSDVRSTIINTSIIASIPLARALMTADIPYSRLVAIVGNNQIAGVDTGAFLTGLQHSLLISSVVIFGSPVFSFLRGPRLSAVPVRWYDGDPSEAIDSNSNSFSLDCGLHGLGDSGLG